MSKCTHYFRLREKIARIITCSGKQALNQNKFHPPSKQPIAAHLPPSLKHPSRAVLGPRHPHQPHTAWQPAGLLCRCWRWMGSLQQGPSEAPFKSAPERKGWGEGEEDRDLQHSTSASCVSEQTPLSALIVHSVLPPTRPARAECKALKKHALGMMRWFIHILRSERRQPKPSHSFGEARERTPTCRGWTDHPWLREALVSLAVSLHLHLLWKLCPFLLSQLKMEAHAVWEPSQSSHWACAMT